MKELLVREALIYIPQILQLVDRNPFSPTYGCFDREYWHYRTLDFPCGMSQEMALPLALLYRNPYPGSPYYGLERMAELSRAGIDFACRSSHRDGSCDDYFPYEQAMGALVFSTYALSEAYRVLGLEDEHLLEFFSRRADLLGRGNETGQLANHQALAALAAYNVYLVTGVDKYRRTAEDRLALTLSWQHPEGWFQEYEGADPGYQSCTIDFLAKYMQKSGDQSLLEPLRRAVDFAWYFMHPDGSYAGEYGSRNTYHFYPHGFEIMAPHSARAAAVGDGFRRSLANGKRSYNCDNRMVSHSVLNWLQAYDDYCEERPEAPEAADFCKWLPGCKMAVVSKPHYYAVANLAKGGSFKVFNREQCLASDTGLLAELEGGKEDGQVLVTHLLDQQHAVKADPETGEFIVRGVFSRRRSKLSSPVKLIIFRLLNLTIGRYFPNLLRLLVQKLLITGKARTPFVFERRLHFAENEILVSDHLGGPLPLKRLAAGSDATSIYVANSNVFQDSVVRIPWSYAPAALLERLCRGGALWRRRLRFGEDGSTCREDDWETQTEPLSAPAAHSQETFWHNRNPAGRRPPEHPVVAAYAGNRIAAMRRHVPISRETSLLELGCGNGFFTLPLSRLCRVSGIDFSESMLALNPHADTRRMDARKLDFPDNSFDVVFCHALLHHVPEFDQVIREMRRVSRRYVVILEPNRNNPLMFLFSALVPEERGALRFSLTFLSDAVKAQHLQVKAAFSMGMLVPNKTPLKLLPWLQKLEFVQPLGMTNFIIAEK
ncbi:MAG: class I SAM-dependent methyltransferase [Deltaproteobacteria bacterium]|nr:class I SAM-dependent methyltransferase [Deltaproteobacteria bacterium]